MQILEWSAMGLRAARINLVSPRSDIIITIFPMVHIGDPAFFQGVYDDAFTHDVALTEGVKSPITLRVTRVYRWAVASKRLALSLQPRPPEPGTVKARIIHADLSADEFRLAWAKVPFWLRWSVIVLSPVMGLRLRWFGTRESIAARMTMDDQPSMQHSLEWSPEAAVLEGAILDARDNRLIERLSEVLDDPQGRIRRVAVVWGAGHVPALLRSVTGRRGYFAEHCTWLTVFGP